MKAVVLVAAREFRQIVSTRGFWIMLLIMPLAIAVSGFVSTVFAPRTGVAVVLVDPSGRYGPLVEQRLEREYQREALRDLSTYVERWKLGSVDATAPWARRDSWLLDSEVARFADQGGTDAAVDRLAPHLPKGATAFEAPDRFFYKVAPPAGVPVDRGAEAFGKAIAPALKGDVETPGGKLPLALAVYIPEAFGTPGTTAQVWTNGSGNPRVLNVVRDELTVALRQKVLEAGGLSGDAARQVQSLNAPIAVSEPPVGKGRNVIATQSIIPIAMVYLLLLTAITTGSMMLQGVVEERSNKLLESVLACIRPAQLMNGKLLGLGGVGLGIVVVWASCAIGAAFFSAGAFADVLRTSVEAIDEPWIWLAMVFYFFAGYLILSMTFLAIGSLSDSMQDAQSYLMPVLVVFMFPVIFMMQATLSSPDSLYVKVLSWIPIYTPFAMLARMGTSVSWGEVVGTGVLLAGFVYLQLMLLGRLFESSVLSAGKPAWRELFAQLRRGSGETEKGARAEVR